MKERHRIDVTLEGEATPEQFNIILEMVHLLLVATRNEWDMKGGRCWYNVINISRIPDTPGPR